LNRGCTASRENTLADQSRKHRLESQAGDGELEQKPSSRPPPFDAAAKQQDLVLLYRALRAGDGQRPVFRAIKELGEIYSDLCKEKAS
jgi:hypothetical protein